MKLASLETADKLNAVIDHLLQCQNIRFAMIGLSRQADLNRDIQQNWQWENGENASHIPWNTPNDPSVDDMYYAGTKLKLSTGEVNDKIASSRMTIQDLVILCESESVLTTTTIERTTLSIASIETTNVPAVTIVPTTTDEQPTTSTSACNFAHATSQYTAFYADTDTVSWLEAKDMCEANGMQLASLTTEGELNAVVSYLDICPFSFYYVIGLSRQANLDRSVDLNWRWETAEALDTGLLTWKASKPATDNIYHAGIKFSPTERIILDRKASNRYTSDLTGILCEYYDAPNSTVEPRPFVCAFNHQPSEYIVYNAGGEFKVSWLEAKAFCEDLDMQLASLTTQDELNFVFGYLSTLCQNIPIKILIGLSRQAGLNRDVDQNWRWETGEVLDTSYIHWMLGSPAVGDQYHAGTKIEILSSEISDKGPYNKMTANGIVILCESIQNVSVPISVTPTVENQRPVVCSFFQSPLEYTAFTAVDDFRVTWTEAKDFCEGSGLKLASLATEEKLNAVVSHLSQCQNIQNVVIGLSRQAGLDRYIDQNWRWETGEVLDTSYIPWSPFNEPSVSNAYYTGTRLHLSTSPVDLRDAKTSLTLSDGSLVILCENDLLTVAPTQPTPSSDLSTVSPTQTTPTPVYTFEMECIGIDTCYFQEPDVYIIPVNTGIDCITNVSDISWTFTDSLNNIISIPSNGSSTAYTFRQDGLHNVTMLRNQVSLSERQVLVITPVSGITVVDGPKVDVLETKTFHVSISNTGHNTCLVIDFGNGDSVRYGVEECLGYRKVPWMGNLSSTLTVTTVCQERLSYNLFIYGFDLFSFERVHFNYVIAPETFDCNVPTLTIIDNHGDPKFPREIELSKDIILNAVLSVDCEILKNEKSWSVERVTPKGSPIEGTRQNVDVETFGDKLFNQGPGSLTLVLRRNSLEVGNYRFIISVSMESALTRGAIFSASQIEYVSITGSHLQVKLIEGDTKEITVGHGDSLVLSPQLFSRDPDVEQAEDQEFDSFEYYCHQTTEKFNIIDDLDEILMPTTPQLPVKGVFSGCFGTGPGKLQLTAGNISLDTSLMMSNRDYVVIVVVKKDSRNGKTAIVVHVQDEPTILPIININVKSSRMDDVLLINPSDDLRASTNQIEPEMEFHWTLSRKKAHESVYQSIQDVSAHTRGENTNYFFISKALFVSDYTYTDYFMTVSAYSPTSMLYGNSSVYFTINLPPSGGVCLLSPRELFLRDAVLVNCSGWTDIVQYAYSVKTSNTSNIRRSLMSGRESVQMLYPLQGHPDQDYMVEIWVNIENSNGVSIEYMVDKIQVRPLEIMDTDGLLDDLIDESAYAKLKAEGNWQDINEHASRSAVLLNAVGDIEVANKSKTAKEQNDDRMKRANVRTAIIQLMLNVTVPPEPNVVSDQLGLLNTVTEKTDEINQDAVGMMLATTVNLADNIEFFQKDSEEKKVLNSAAQALVVVGNVLEASSRSFSNPLHNGSDAVQANMQVAELDSLFDRLVDISLEGKSPNEPKIDVQTPTFNLSMQRLTAKGLDQEDFQAGAGKFAVPSCEILMGEEACSIGNAVDIQVVETYSNPYNFVESVNRISNNSAIISLLIKGENGAKQSVSGTVEPIEIIIPRRGAASIKWMNITAEPINEKFRMYHRVDIEITGTAITMDFQPHCINTTYEVTLGHDDYPDTDNNIFLEIVHALENIEDNGYRIFISSSIIGERTGVFYLGVAELKEVEDDALHSSSSSSVFVAEEPVFISETFTCNYSVRIFLSGCNFWSETEVTWTNNGCDVGRETDVSHTQCLCTHLTSFASSFIIPPAPLDFNYIFANAGFLDNIAIYVTCITSYVLFIVIFIWARRKDKKDETMVGMVQLADNNINDRYFYEITIVTADRISAGTKSKVSLIISGSKNDTNVRTFDKIDRPIFQRGAVDKFLMSTPRDLGTPETVRIWHDNSGKGKSQSWYLNAIILRNILTGEVQQFLFNNWLSLTDGDGLVVRSSFAASASQIKGFSHLFGGHARKAIRDDHLWFSIFLRPPESSFTRLQRTVCCMMVMWLEMLVNIMWYKSMPPPESTKTISLGPIKVTTAEIGIGVMSNLIVLPVSVLVISLFKNARRRSQLTVFADLLQQRLKEKEASEKLNVHLEEVTVNGLQSCKKDKEIQKIDQSLKSNGIESEQINSNIKRKRRKKNKKKPFPWWVIIPAWILAVLAILVSTLFVIFYAIQMGNEEAVAWLTSLLVSIFFGILLTQPIKGLLIALLVASICKSSVQDNDDVENEDDVPDDLSDNDESENCQAEKSDESNVNSGEDLAKSQLQMKRNQRLFEMKLDSILKDIIVHFIFVFVAFIICYSEFDSNANRYKIHLENTFVKSSSTGILPFEELSYPGNFWPWMRSIFLPALYAPSLFDDSYLDNTDDILADEMSYILGYPVLRQLRVKPDLCELHKKVRNISKECNIGYSILHEDTANYGAHWVEFNSTDVSNPFTYRNASKINGYPLIAHHAIYSGGGYIFKMKGRMLRIVENLEFLFSTRWFDQYTRALFLELFLYNPQVNLFASVVLLLEVLPTGGSYPFYRIDVIRLFPNIDSFYYIILVCKFLFVILLVFFAFKELKKIYKEKKKYFLKISNILEFIITSLSLFSFVMFLMRMQIINSVVKEIEDKDGSGHVNLALAVYFNDIFSCLLGFILFFGTFKFLKLLRFNSFIAVFLKMFQHCATDLLSYFLFLWIIFIAFTSLFYITFLTILHDYSSFITTAESILDSIMGNFQFETINTSLRIIGPVYLFSLLVSFAFFFFNMFLAIMMEAYEVVADDIVLEVTASDIWQHLKKKFRIKKSRPVKEDKIEENISPLQTSVDNLLMQISNMYIHELHYSNQIDALNKSQFFSTKHKKKSKRSQKHKAYSKR